MKNYKKISPVVVLILLILVFISCEISNSNKNSDELVEVQKGDTVFRYFDKEKTHLAELRYYKDDQVYVEHFSSEGYLIGEGFVINDSIPIGMQNYYRQDGSVLAKEEFKFIANAPYLNQQFIYDNQNQLTTEGHFFYCQINDTLKGNQLKGFIELDMPYFRTDSVSVHLITPKNIRRNFKKDFSNIDKVKRDTFVNLSLDTINYERLINHPNSSPFIPNLSIAFNKEIEVEKDFYFRAILVEKSHKGENENERFYYIEKKIIKQDKI